MAAITAGSAYAGAIFTATETCTSSCFAAWYTMKYSASYGACDACTSNTGNSSIASWGPSSANCTTCANQWASYSSSCSGGANRPCFNWQTIGSGSW